MMRLRKKYREPLELNEMPNRGGLIETDSVRHFFDFDIMETGLFFIVFFLPNAVLRIACSISA